MQRTRNRETAPELGVIKRDNDDNGDVSIPITVFSLELSLDRLYLAPVNYCTCIPIVNDVIISDKDM